VTPERADVSEIATKLEPWLRRRMPQGDDLSISNLRSAERGMSTDTFHLELSWPTQTDPAGLVLRRPPEIPLFPDYDLRRQFRVMQCLQGTAIPVPNAYWIETDPSIIGTPFYVMEEILGGVTPSDVPAYHTAGAYFEAMPEKRAKMWWGCVESIAAVHALDWRSLGLSFLARPNYGEGRPDQVVSYLESSLRWAQEKPQPILDGAIEWLRQNDYRPERVTLCWGDARMSNILYDSNFDVLAVLDWEIAYLGDHEFDIAWLLFLEWMNSVAAGAEPLEGTPSREETIRRYEQLAGLPIKNLLFNEVLAALLLAVPLVSLTKRFRRAGLLGNDVELSALSANRISELLDLTGRTDTGAPLEESARRSHP
jgi:aminoglycoside phosphotransferase (APT) family kinase protein